MDSWTLTGSLGQSLVGSLLLSPGSWCTQDSVFALQESVSPDLCKFWWLYVGVNGVLPQECLCQTQVCCTQSPCPHSSPLLTHTSSGDTETQFCLSFCVVSGSWRAPGVFELWVSLKVMGFVSKRNLAPLTIFLGLLLFPWMWDISSQSLQHCVTAVQVLSSRCGVSAPSQSSMAQVKSNAVRAIMHRNLEC